MHFVLFDSFTSLAELGSMPAHVLLNYLGQYSSSIKVTVFCCRLFIELQYKNMDKYCTKQSYVTQGNNYCLGSCSHDYVQLAVGIMHSQLVNVPGFFYSLRCSCGAQQCILSASVADPHLDSAFHLDADLEPEKTNADPDLHPGQTLLSQKVEFYMKNILKYTKAFLKGWNSGLFVHFSQFLCSWIRNRIPDMVPDQERQINADPC